MDWPLDLPADAVLALPGSTKIAWAEFDTEWFRRTYANTDMLSGQDGLHDYATIGQKKGLSPNIYVDEAWQRAAYPRLAELIRAGEYASAFDAYCRRGCLDRSAHWLFDELLYRDRNPDLTDDVLRGAGLANGYDHYLRHGVHEDRIGHLLFDPRVYRANFDEADRSTVQATGAFRHYLRRLDTRMPELRTTPYFDPEWYLHRYPAVAAEIGQGRWKSALHHYLCNAEPTSFDPLADFSETFYLGRDAGLREAVASGQFRNGYVHFLRFGKTELRAPAPHIDLAWYAGQQAVKHDLACGVAPDAFTHWLTTGLRQRLPTSPAPEERDGEAYAAVLSARKAVACLPSLGRAKLDFVCRGEPAVSVVVVVQHELATLLSCLAALRSATALPLQLILVDVEATEAARQILPSLLGARLLQLATGTPWSVAADAGRQLAAGAFTLFLSSSAHPEPFSIDRAHGRLLADPRTGAVGGMVLGPDAMISEAGGILWRDSGMHPYMKGQSPLAAEANFVRTADFCGKSFLLADARLLAELGGFDHGCDPGYETADLCLRIAAAGRAVVYDPSVVVTETAPLPGTAGLDAHMRAVHRDALARHHEPGGPQTQVFARHAGPRQTRVLLIEDTVPVPRLGSGFVRANDIVHAIAATGAMVTVFPMDGIHLPVTEIYGAMPDSAEVMHDLSLGQLEGFLRTRHGYYDLIWVSRSHNLLKIRPILAKVFRGGAGAPRLIFDSEALTPLREAQRARLSGLPHDAEAELRTWTDLTSGCATTVAVTASEADILRAHAIPDVAVIGHAVQARPTPRAFDDRAGLLFVGAIHTQDSPNLDSLRWFANDVLPLLEARLGWEARLTVAGYVAPGIDLGFLQNDARIDLHGPVVSLQPLYDRHRVFIAPTRYAAGAPYKVLEAAAHGIPIVCAEVLRRQLGWMDSNEVLACDPADGAAFADAVASVYRHAGLWQTLRDGALSRLRKDCDVTRFQQDVADVLARALARPDA